MQEKSISRKKMSLLVDAASAAAYRPRLKRKAMSGKRRTPLMDEDQRLVFLQKVEQEKAQGRLYPDAEVVTHPFDPELAGDGQFFCAWCARHFTNADVLEEHEKSKTHKRRRKEVEKEGVYDQEIISELAVGFTRETKKPRAG